MDGVFDFGDLNKRALEERRPYQDGTVPLHLRVHLKQLQRHRAAGEGEPVPYEEDELHYLYQEDLLDAAGEGTIATYRDVAGWQTEEGRRMLDEWQLESMERLERVKEAGDNWREIYQKDYLEEGEE